MKRYAVIGSGVSGLTAAHVLARHGHVTLFEADTRLGGHAHTHALTNPHSGRSVNVDSGFIVHNDRTYPTLLRLFAELGVSTRPTQMSMSISDTSTGIEYAGGMGVGGFVARPAQLADPRYLRTLRQVRRFHRLASRHLQRAPTTDSTTYGRFLDHHGFDTDFLQLYAVPLVSCVWSSGRTDALGYPARHLFAFLAHHGMLAVGGSPQWRTVVGGSATYVQALAARLPDVRPGCAVRSLERVDGGVLVLDAAGHVERFSAVVVATHADQALALLADATPAEKDVLGAFRYSRNETVLHRDPTLMPRTRGVWAAWNHRARSDDGAPVVTYWMNRLHGIDPADPYFVTLNATDEVDPATIIARMSYEHPVFDTTAVAAQRRLPEIASDTTVFAGAYHGWGFHEDGALSGVRAAERLGVSW